MTDKNPHKPFRFTFSFVSGKYDLRVQAHEDDPNLLVLKSGNPEAVDHLIMATGVDPEITSRFKGDVYHIAFASKAGVAKLIGAAVLAGLATKAEMKAQAMLAATADADDDVTGDDDEEETEDN